MPFWSTNKIQASYEQLKLIDPYQANHVMQGAYEMSMGPQAAISTDGRNSVINLKEREAVTIPPGQFALLLTEEKVKIPGDVVAFISLKTGFKSQGLVNVSGFHVDPGYNARLKFWVYNAGNQHVSILRGDRTFLIWFADMDQATSDPYDRNGPHHNEITAADLRNLQGTLASPSALKEGIDVLNEKYRRVNFVANTLIVVVSGLLLALAAPLWEYLFTFVFGSR